MTSLAAFSLSKNSCNVFLNTIAKTVPMTSAIRCITIEGMPVTPATLGDTDIIIVGIAIPNKT